MISNATIDTIIMSATFLGTAALGALRWADKRWQKQNIADPMQDVAHFTTKNGHKNDPETLRDVTATIVEMLAEQKQTLDGVQADVKALDQKVDTETGKLWTALAQRPNP